LRDIYRLTQQGLWNIFVYHFKKKEISMATVNFSVPDAVKEAFNDVFTDINQCDIISDLMMRAVEDEKRRKRRGQAVDRLLARRGSKRPVTRDEIRSAREELRS
jgi:hypothetical protein